MTRFALGKLLRLVLLLVAVSACSFTLLSFSPIDPVQAYIGADMMTISPEQRDLIGREAFHADNPIGG